MIFILLVFFMLASSFLDWHSIDLSPPARGAAVAPMEGALLVEIRPEGLRVSGERMSLDTLGERVRRRVSERPDQRVLVQPAPGVPLQDAMRVLDRLAIVGVTPMTSMGPSSFCETAAEAPASIRGAPTVVSR